MSGVNDNDASSVAVGYVHFLSKRTALYAAAARINNHGKAAFVVADGSPPGVPVKASSGLQFGVAHSF